MSGFVKALCAGCLSAVLLAAMPATATTITMYFAGTIDASQPMSTPALDAAIPGGTVFQGSFSYEAPGSPIAFIPGFENFFFSPTDPTQVTVGAYAFSAPGNYTLLYDFGGGNQNFTTGTNGTVSGTAPAGLTLGGFDAAELTAPGIISGITALPTTVPDLSIVPFPQFVMFFRDDANNDIRLYGTLSYLGLTAPPQTTVPEPAMVGLFGIGLVAFGMLRRKTAV